MKPINLETAINIAKKYPESYNIYHGKGYTNVIRHVKEKSGKYTTRIQSFDNNGNLMGTTRSINDTYSIYSNPSSGLIGIQYFTKIKDPNDILGLGYRLKSVRAETTAKNIGDIKAFYESQAHNMK